MNRSEPIAVDQVERWPVLQSETLVSGAIFDLARDRIQTPDGSTITRDYLRHPGAVAVVALDDQDRMVLVHQYRHPVRMRLVEPPAGLLDVDQESWLDAARRELAEEVELAADDWSVLVDYCTSPGSTSESVRIFLARGLHRTARPDGFEVAGEEADMVVSRVPLDEVVAAVLAGQAQNPSLVAGALAAALVRDRGWQGLRPADAPWPTRTA